jgi:hypothetical protein
MSAELIAHLVKCRTCRGTGALPAVISLGGGSKKQDMGSRVVVKFQEGSQHPAVPSERTPFTVIAEREAEVETAVAS